MKGYEKLLEFIPKKKFLCSELHNNNIFLKKKYSKYRPFINYIQFKINITFSSSRILNYPPKVSGCRPQRHHRRGLENIIARAYTGSFLTHIVRY